MMKKGVGEGEGDLYLCVLCLMSNKIMLCLCYIDVSEEAATVVQTKSDSDVTNTLFTIAKYNTHVYTSLELTRIDRSLVY